MKTTWQTWIGVLGTGLLLSAFLLWLGGRTIIRSNMDIHQSWWEQGILEVVKAPKNLRKILRDPDIIKAPDKPQNLPKPPGPVKRVGQETVPIKKKLLYSSYNYDEDIIEAQLVELNTGRTLQKWGLPFSQAQAIYRELQKKHLGTGQYPFLETKRSLKLKRTAFYHPLKLPDKRLLVALPTGKSIGPLVCLDSASRILWKSPKMVHHSKEKGPNGHIWAPSRTKPTRIAQDSGNTFSYAESTIVQIHHQTGEVLFEQKISKIINQSRFSDPFTVNLTMYDRYHLNDVQPVFEAGPYWQPGDIFISIRHTNTALLYRPANDSLLWCQTGPWKGQHDINVVNDSVISIFDNNLLRDIRHKDPKSGIVPGGKNKIYFYNFASKRAFPRFDSLMAAQNICTPTQGRAHLHPTDSLLFVESNAQGKILLHNFKTQKSYSLVLPSSRSDRVRNLYWTRLLN